MTSFFLAAEVGVLFRRPTGNAIFECRVIAALRQINPLPGKNGYPQPERGSWRKTMERIVVAVDGSPGSSKAVDFAADLAVKFDAELILLTVARHAAPVLDPAFEEYARIEHLQGSEAGFAAAENVLAGARIAAQAKGATRISTAPSVGDPAEEIIRCAKECRADLVVVGSRGHGRLAGLLLGSVAQKVIGLAPCPVTIVR
jgi:nucleotide-binding universal stress UspA family protein